MKRWLESIPPDRARRWLAAALGAWSLLVFGFAAWRAWSVWTAAACPTDESIAAFCRSQAIDATVGALRNPLLVYLGGLVLVGAAWTWTMLDRP